LEKLYRGSDALEKCQQPFAAELFEKTAHVFGPVLAKEIVERFMPPSRF